MQKSELQEAANTIKMKIEEYMMVKGLSKKPEYEQESNLQVFFKKQKVMEYLQENAQTLKAVIIAGLIVADGDIITDCIIADAKKVN